MAAYLCLYDTGFLREEFTIQSVKVVLLKTLLRLCSWLPLRLAHGLGSLIGRAAWLLDTRSCRITKRNIELCYPQRSVQEREQLAKDSLVQTAQAACELGMIWLSPASVALDKVVKVSGRELLDEALAKGKGLILLAPHLGSWELCGLYLDSYAQCTYLYKPPKLAEFEAPITKYRGRLGARLAPTTPKGVAMLIKALGRGEIAGILPDQEPNLASGVFAPFFGVPALTMTLVSKLAKRTAAPVLSIVAKRLPRGQGFEIIVAKACAGIDDSDTLRAATALNQTVEACVGLAPEQYQWEYKRFKCQPEQAKNVLYR